MIDHLFDSADILCIQETLLPRQDLDKLNSVHDDFYGAEESTTDLSLGINVAGYLAVWPYSGKRSMTH